MKRSEMLERIRKFNSYIDPDDDTSYEEQILWFVEIMGMLPPMAEIPNLGRKENYWESENEECNDESEGTEL